MVVTSLMRFGNEQLYPTESSDTSTLPTRERSQVGPNSPIPQLVHSATPGLTSQKGPTSEKEPKSQMVVNDIVLHLISAGIVVVGEGDATGR